MSDQSLSHAISEVTSDNSSESTQIDSNEDQAPPAPRRVRVKLFDEEREVPEEELVRSYQKDKASDRRFQEAAQIKKQYQDLLNKARVDPGFLFQELGLDSKSWAQELLLKEVEEAMEQEYLESLDLESRKKHLKAKEYDRLQKLWEEQREQQLQERREQLLLDAENEIQEEISASLAEHGIRPTARTLARVADYLLAELDEKGTRPKAKDAIKRVMADFDGDLKDFFENNPLETWINKLPKSALDALRKADLDLVRSKAPHSWKGSNLNSSGKPKKEVRRPVDPDEFFK